MENIDLQEYLNNLTPEQREKALKCKTNEELIQLAADEDLEIPMDALAGVAGGLSCDANNKKPYCIKHGIPLSDDPDLAMHCFKCGRVLNKGEYEMK